LSEVYSRERAGRWFLGSGIQEPSGGVARFYLADARKNKPVSTEITGYAASALAFLHRATGDARFLDRARRTAFFLADRAWDPALGIFPYEYPSPSALSRHLAFFFDSGIIVRGLLAVWRITKDQRLLDAAEKAARGMLADFHSGSDFHPILVLPDKTPFDRDSHWSRSPGCYQAKSALAWLEVAEITGDSALRDAYLETISGALRAYRDFLPGTPERLRVMDRLHAAGYFLEALSPLLDRAECVEAYRFTMQSISRYLRDLAPEFARSDVYAQLLRARVYASDAIPADVAAAREEAAALAGFQAASPDPRVDGGFWFGRRGDETIPHVNPVSTAFAVQALEAWRAFESGEPNPCVAPPI
jgi:hypothetical protein